MQCASMFTAYPLTRFHTTGSNDLLLMLIKPNDHKYLHDRHFVISHDTDNTQQMLYISGTPFITHSFSALIKWQ